MGFPFNPWNIFDTIVVLAWLIDALSRDLVDLPISMTFLRLCRLARLLRLVKLAKVLEAVDPLFLMITSLKGSLAILFWAALLTLVCQTLVGFLLNQMLVNYFFKEGEGSSDPDAQQRVFELFGTFTRSMWSMVELTFGNY